MESAAGSSPPDDPTAAAGAPPRGGDGPHPPGDPSSTGRPPAGSGSRPSGADGADARRQRARLGSAHIAEQSRLRRRNYDSSGLSQAGESGRRRRLESEERQQRVLEDMASINQSNRAEEAGAGAVSGSASSLSTRPRSRSRGSVGRQSSAYEDGPVPGEMLSGGRSRGFNRGGRADDLEEAIRDGLEEHHEQSPPWEGAGLLRFRAAPPAGAVGLESVFGGVPLSGGPDELLGMLLASRERFLEQAEEMQMAMAMSLSLEDQGGGSEAGDRSEANHMSYENLVDLENVRVTVPQAVVGSFPTHKFGSPSCPTVSDHVCAICQLEFESGEELMALPCSHLYHKECGSEWLTKYSRSCPVCKTPAWEG